jgi:GNAT superfamily N-acetyltransferase
MNIEIRKAKKSEINVLLAFEQAIIATERPFDNSLQNEEIHYYNLITLMGSSKATVLVAVVNNEIVGSGFAKIMTAKSYQKHKKYAYLGFMYVKDEFRGKGINRKIIENLIEWSKNKNLEEVRLHVYNDNLSAKNAYLKTGFKPTLLEMQMSVNT